MKVRRQALPWRKYLKQRALPAQSFGDTDEQALAVLLLCLQSISNYDLQLRTCKLALQVDDLLLATLAVLRPGDY